jgi:hypothetical protein
MLHEHTFVMRGISRSLTDIERVLSLLQLGLSDYEIARRTDIPRSTVLNWRRGRLPRTPFEEGCPRCRGPEHDFSALPVPTYAYVLGQYLGDGSLFHTGKIGRGLRIASDAQYGGVIRECCDAIEAIRGRRPHLRRHRESGWSSLRRTGGRGRACFLSTVPEGSIDGASLWPRGK